MSVQISIIGLRVCTRRWILLRLASLSVRREMLKGRQSQQ
jgi:hypothetical protein